MSETPSPESQRIFAPNLFRGQVALITGGGSGIGLAVATEFARLGAQVAICGRKPDKLAQAQAAIAAAAASATAAATLDTATTAPPAPAADDVALAAPCDIREPESVATFVRTVMDRFGRIDVLVNNAGGQFPAPAQNISPNGFAAVVRNNLIGTFHVTREVANQAMIPARSGRIVNVIANIYRGFPGMVHTGAARAGVENMTMSLAVEWSRMGILVNAVAPGVILSSGTGQYPPALLEQAIRKIPVGRAGTVDEVAATILFLASPAAQFITGATLRIDGAQSLWGDVFPLAD